MQTILFILAWTVTWLGFENVELKTIHNINDHDNVNDQAPEPPTVTCYRFANWIGSADNVTSDTIIRAVYKQYKYSLSIDTEHEYYRYGDIEAQGMSFNESYVIEHILCGETVTVYAKPHNGYKFVKWVLNDEEQATTSSTFEVPMTEAVAQPVLNPPAGKDDGNVAIYAVFEVDPATDITNANADINAYKRIENNHVVIIRNNEKYDVTGKKL